MNRFELRLDRIFPLMHRGFDARLVDAHQLTVGQLGEQFADYLHDDRSQQADDNLADHLHAPFTQTNTFGPWKSRGSASRRFGRSGARKITGAVFGDSVTVTVWVVVVVTVCFGHWPD